MIKKSEKILYSIYPLALYNKNNSLRSPTNNIQIIFTNIHKFVLSSARLQIQQGGSPGRGAREERGGNKKQKRGGEKTFKRNSAARFCGYFLPPKFPFKAIYSPSSKRS